MRLLVDCVVRILQFYEGVEELYQPTTQVELVVCLVSEINVALTRHFDEFLWYLPQIHVELCVSKLWSDHRILANDRLNIDD